MKRLLDPKKIQEKSFQIIDGLLRSSKLPAGEKKILQRVIHATTDTGYAQDLCFHPKAVASGIKAIRLGKNVVCDVNMVKAGVNAKLLAGFGGKVLCRIDDEDVVRKASKGKITRAILAVRKSVAEMAGGIVSIGNAPTALFELCDLIKKGKAKPALVVGIPVGFVGALESKQELMALGIPYITNQSPKGGSSVAAAMTNALLHLAKED